MKRTVILALSLIALGSVHAEELAPTQSDYTIRNFKFASGETLPELRIHYRTVGKLQRDSRGVAQNAVLILHGTGGSGTQFMRPEFAGQLFVEDGPLDPERYFIILPDGIGHGQSSKPSDGMHAKFPRYGYTDMVEAQHRLVTEGLKINHLALVLGTSMGGMQTWVWGERYPDFMDALMPLASLPTQISGRNRAWRRTAIDAIRNDPDWKGGEYSTQPGGLRTAQQLLFLMGSSSVLRQQQMGTLAESDKVFDAAVSEAVKSSDANDLVYQLEASYDYDPGPGLEKIKARLVAVNFADDLINPPELGILEREVARIPNGRAIVMAASPATRGHGTHTVAAVWKRYLQEIFAQPGPRVYSK
jgi:homoserine O-acetyltransferase